MKFSIIIPSYNQDKYIAQTFENLKELKERVRSGNISIEILLFDSCSNDKVQDIIEEYKDVIDYIEIKKDAGQFDAINKGIEIANGDYWTWLNTDDLIEIEGFVKLAGILEADGTIDYIYGGVKYINEKGEFMKDILAKQLSLNHLVNKDPGIYQPGSFFKKTFTDKIGILKKYNCCFDYEYVLRLLSNDGKVYVCDFIVSRFRLHSTSKTGSIVPVFVKEQLEISKKYERKFLSKHTLIAHLRLLKHQFFRKKG